MGILEGNRVTTRISVRGFAVASATAVTTVGAVVGVASGGQQGTAEPAELAAADATLLADIPVGGNTETQTTSLSQQADTQSDAANAAAKKAAEESARKQAAQNAADKKKAAEAKKAELAAKKAAEEREKERAARDSARPDLGDFPEQGSYTVAQVKAMAQQIVGGGQFQCFSNIVQRESTWNYQAQNPSSGAYGLVQALPGSKMASAGADWRTNPATQIKWGVQYMNERYGSPCGAWEFWQANHWY